MKIVLIKIEDIDVTGRLRPVHLEVVSGLAGDIKSRGLRQPIEVVKQSTGRPYRLVSGGHRLGACTSLEWSEISAVIVTGSEDELRADELLENLARSELSRLERAQFLAELKGVFQSINPDAKHGGDRTVEQNASLASWYDVVASRSQDSIRKIKQYTAIGEHLTDDAAAAIRGTEFEEKLNELEALSRLEADQQTVIVARLTCDKENRPTTVAQAVKIEYGHADKNERSKDDQQYSKLLDTWNRTSSTKARNQFLDFLAMNGFVTGVGGN